MKKLLVVLVTALLLGFIGCSPWHGCRMSTEAAPWGGYSSLPCYQFQNWMNGNFPLGIFAVIFWGGLILFGFAYLLQKSIRFLRSRSAGQSTNRYDSLKKTVQEKIQ